MITFGLYLESSLLSRRAHQGNQNQDTQPTRIDETADSLVRELPQSREESLKARPSEQVNRGREHQIREAWCALTLPLTSWAATAQLPGILFSKQ